MSTIGYGLEVGFNATISRDFITNDQYDSIKE
jgi:hypothetical protein